MAVNCTGIFVRSSPDAFATKSTNENKKALKFSAPLYMYYLWNRSKQQRYILCPEESTPSHPPWYKQRRMVVSFLDHRNLRFGWKSLSKAVLQVNKPEELSLITVIAVA